MPGDCLKIFFLNVGQGDTICGLLPDGHSFIVDVFNEHKVNEFIDDFKINECEFILISHHDIDHFGKIVNLVNNSNLGIKKIFRNHDVSPKSKHYKNYLDFLKKIHEWKNSGRINAVSFTDTDTSINASCSGVDISVLHPENSFTSLMIEEDKRNESSIVLKIVFKGKTFILTGDIEELGINELIKNNEDLKCDILKVPHHGAWPDNDSLVSLIDKTTPDYAVISVGTTNTYKHPDDRTIKALTSNGIKVFCTQATEKCFENIEKTREQVLRVYQKHELNCDDLDKPEECVCAGDVVFTIDDEGITVTPDNTVNEKIKTFFENRLCK